MSTLPSQLKYAKSHEWVLLEADGSVTVGITDHAQNALGDLVYAETPKVGRVLQVGEACAVVESVKAASDVYAPVAGQVTAINAGLIATPELINTAPYTEGWMWKMTVADPSTLHSLLDAAGYASSIA